MGKAVEPRESHRDDGIGFKPATGLQEPSCEPMALKGLSKPSLAMGDWSETGLPKRRLDSIFLKESIQNMVSLKILTVQFG
jgi:hypothetical protein